MRIRAAGKAAHARIPPGCGTAAGRTASAGTRPLRFGFIPGFLAAGLAACGNDVIENIPQKSVLATGEPTVGPSAGSVQYRQAPSPGDFSETNPFQIDNFVQQATAKVDVLWVIDNSGSMAPKQAKVEADFQSFITQLTQPGSNQEVVDYHIGVITSDTYDPAQSGKLQNLAHLSSPWIGNMDTCQPPCDPVKAFQTTANVGTTGNGDSKHLLAASMALTEPLISVAPPNGNLGFLRDDASLAIIVVTDEDDPSCAPLSPNFPEASPSCSESDITAAGAEGWGSIYYYSRLFRELKGFGNEWLVSESPFVDTTQTIPVPDTKVSATNTSEQMGCILQQADGGPAVDPANPFSYATYAQRHIEVANLVAGLALDYPPDTTGSPAHSICNDSFAAANQTIATYATLQDTFFLSRQPADPNEVQACVNTPCTNSSPFCGSTAGDGGSSACTYDANRNAVSFAIVPPAGATIQIAYKVHANAI